MESHVGDSTDIDSRQLPNGTKSADPTPPRPLPISVVSDQQQYMTLSVAVDVIASECYHFPLLSSML